MDQILLHTTLLDLQDVGPYRSRQVVTHLLTLGWDIKVLPEVLLVVFLVVVFQVDSLVVDFLVDSLVVLLVVALQVETPGFNFAPIGAPGPDPTSLAMINVLNQIASNLTSFQTPSDTKMKQPDAFDGSDPYKLRKFLVTVQLNINVKPKAYDTDSKKISYVLSYLSGAALDWFEPEILYGNRTNPPAWLVSFPSFIKELQDNFGHFDIKGDAENRLGKLVMGKNERIVKYNTKFNQYTALVDWDNRALRFFYRKGLALRIKEELSHRTEEKSLNDFKVQCSEIDNKYWIFDAEKKEVQRSRDAKKENPKLLILLLPIRPPLLLHPPLHPPTSQLPQRKHFQVPRRLLAPRLLPLRSLMPVFWEMTAIFSTANGNIEGKLDFVFSVVVNTNSRIVTSGKRAKRQRSGLQQSPRGNPKHRSRKISPQLR